VSHAERSALSLIGLGWRARRVVPGVEATREAVRRGVAELIVLAGDAGERARDRLVALAQHRGVPLLEGPRAERLGGALGRPPTHAVAVLDRQLARGLRAYLAAQGRGEKKAG
jgi:ribosomal protein L7Ae-like RNA K-turn-binding protein